MPVKEYWKGPKDIEWIDISQPTPEELIVISEKYKLHHYTLKDCLEPDHLPKYEELENANFIITRIYTPVSENESHTIQSLSNKVAVFYNESYIITIHKTSQPFLEEIKLKYAEKGRIRTTSEIVTKIVWYVLHSYDLPAIKLSEQVDSYESQIFLKQIGADLLEGLLLS